MALLLPGCRPGGQPPPKSGVGSQSTPTRSVRVGKVVSGYLDRAVQVTGTLAPIDLATLSTKVAGRLETLPVDLGSEVRKGSVIARLESRDHELRLLQAQALLAQARAPLGLPLDGVDDSIEFEKTSTVKQARALLDESLKARDRALKLRAQGILPDAELEAVEAGFRVAETKDQLAGEEVRQKQALLAQRRVQVEVAKQELADTQISAPFDGRVVERRAQPGEILAIGSPVISIVRMDPLRLRVDVSERDAPKIKIGQHVRITIDGDTNHFSGELKRLSPVISDQSRTLTAEADFQNTDGSLRPGAFARAEIIVAAQESVLLAPAQAIATFAGLEKVFLVKDGKALERSVITGRREGALVEILSGAKENDVVVLDPGSLRTGQLVTVENPPAKGGPQPPKRPGS